MNYKNRKLVYGVGINDADYAVNPTINGKKVMCKFYRAWANMLQRCYDPKCHAIRPTYVGCTVTEEWHYFMSFREWMLGQNWEGKQLDKDLLVEGNKIYGPEFCVFADQPTNSLFIDSAAARGDLPVGVDLTFGKYRASLSVEGKTTHLGCFYTPEEAHNCYLTAKAIKVMSAAYKQDDARIKDALIDRSISMSDRAMTWGEA